MPVQLGKEIDFAKLEAIARTIRFQLVQMHHKAGTAHLAGSLSCVDILVAAYWTALRIDPKNPNDHNRDRFILSKGHAATSLYAALANKDFFPLDLLKTYAESGSVLAEHPGVGCVPGVEVASGSLGHGLSLGIGMALAARIQKRNYRVFVVLSDGECNEGSVWEAAMFAPAQKLENMVAIVDFNKWQATGRSTEIMALEPLQKKWEAFGWSSYEIDGHDLKALTQLLSTVPDGSGKPMAVVAHTVKGKGISFAEDDNNWHYRVPNVEEVELMRKELGIPA